MSSDPHSNGLKVLNGLVGVALLIALVGYVVLNRPAQPTTKELPEGAFKAAVLESNVPVLVDFYADWCGPCRTMSSILDEFSNSNPEREGSAGQCRQGTRHCPTLRHPIDPDANGL